ncbi:RNA polymerase sigma factor [Bacillus sp. FJAT-27225]|uniref:RNA polymerase sigma factor n=1 Tax=Bacillus sp. FJAT-27225 TaxID=1743144 RepID=UPI000B07D45A|nr:RNA polymerase sigma factor [Bacillus sp. FJAT-27225]
MEGQLDIESLYREYHRDIYQFCLYFTNSVQDAEDLTQETFIKAIKNLKSLEKQDRAKYWLLSIARHSAIDHIRKRKLKTIVPLLIEKLKMSNSMEKSLDEHVLKMEEWGEVQAALLKLKPDYRTILILRGLQELTIKETSEVLQQTELKVRVDFHRAVKELKKHMNVSERMVLTDGKERRTGSRS